MIFWFDYFGLFLLIAGLIIGQGAVIVIDWHGFLARKSSYWTLATTRTHKITKPLIWLGLFLVFGGSLLFYRNDFNLLWPKLHFFLLGLLIVNGLFLSFKVSPFLLKREKEGRADQILPTNWQNKITVSFILSFLGWWTSVLGLVWYLLVLK